LFDKYWAEEYSNRSLNEPDAARNRLLRAIRALGHLSLRSSSREEMQAFIDQNYKGNKQRAIVSALNQLLRWMGRDIRLRKTREEIKPIKYLKLNEFFN